MCRFSSKVVVIGLASVIGLGAAFSANLSGVLSSDVQYEQYAEEIVATCSDAEYRPTCYDEEIPQLMDRGMSMEEVFEVTKVIQTLDDAYQYCHVLGHLVAAKETAKDPENWKAVIARAPLGVCSNGAIHGAFQERFRVESFEGRPPEEVVQEIKGICDPRDDWRPTPMGVATCSHALGHLTMYVTDAQIHDALELCDDLIEADGAVNSHRQLCYDGAFMQIYQPLEPDDFALIKGKEVETQEASELFCSQFSGSEYGSCVSESWPLYKDEILVPQMVTVVCDRITETGWQFDRCMNGMFYVAMAQSNLSVDWALTFCSAVPDELSELCFQNSATRLIEVDDRNVDKALQLCHRSTQVGAHDACYDELLKFSTYTLKIDSPAFVELCSGMPNPWRDQCLDQRY